MRFMHVSADAFIAQRNQLRQPLQPFIDLHTADEYAAIGTRLFLSEDRLSGFGVTADGSIISIFSLARGRGDTIVAAAIAAGGTHLDCLGEHLRRLYERCGFQVVEQCEWNQEYAPDNWDYERFGQPHYYAMVLAS